VDHGWMSVQTEGGDERQRDVEEEKEEGH